MHKPTFKANLDLGEGSIGNLTKFRESGNSVLRADLLRDWIYELEKEYESTLNEMTPIGRLALFGE
jgi:hypothetical protein